MDDLEAAEVADVAFFGTGLALADFALDKVDLDALDAEDTAETMLPTSDSLSDIILKYGINWNRHTVSLKKYGLKCPKFAKIWSSARSDKSHLRN